MTEAIAIQGSDSEALAARCDLVEEARAYAEGARSDATVRAYRRAWRTFAAWCDGEGFDALPAVPEVVALYLVHRKREGRKVATLHLDLAAISEAHKAARLPSPRSSAEVQAVLAGIKRAHGTAQKQKAAITRNQLREAVAALPASLIGLRDRALLLVGFITACRRSELVALDLDDVASTPRGLELTVQRSKTDQQGAGMAKAVPFSTACTHDDGCKDALCAVHALARWVAAAGIEDGPLFRSVRKSARVGNRLDGKDVARIVKRSLARIGVDASDFAGHSLRAGFVTAAIEAGKSSVEIRQQTGHRSDAMLARYFRSRDRYRAAIGVL